MNAVAHIYDGGLPRGRDGGGRVGSRRNTLLGLGIHSAASVWWALFFEALPRRLRDRRGAVAVAGLAYLVDYHVVHRRFRPGFEKHLSTPSLFAIYAALAGGFAIAGRLNRRLDDHQKENRDERDESRPAKRRPHRVVAPEPLA